MFDIGFWEMLMIAVIGLLVIGPKRLPEVARALGRWTAKLRNFVASTRADLEREFNATEVRQMLDSKQDEINELRQMINDTRASIDDGASEVERSIKSPESPASKAELDAPDNNQKDEPKA